MRMTEDRYEVGNQELQDLIGTRSSRASALAFAKHIESRHADGTAITVFDRMAHRGAPELWAADGRELRRKAVAV